MMKRWVGIAGYMGSGKSVVAAAMVSHGFSVIDADDRAKRCIRGSPLIQESICSRFGADIVGCNGVRFDLLGERVFASSQSLRDYNALVHPAIVADLSDLLHDQSNENVVLDAALIPYWGIEGWFSTCLWIDASAEVRVNRLRQRTSLSLESLRERMALQQSLFAPPEGRRWTMIDNQGSLQDLGRTIAELIQSGVLIKKNGSG